MQFRRSGPSDERRRRVFRDEMLATDDPDSEASENSRSSGDESDGRVYSDAALAQRQAPLTSLLPQRSLTLIALFLGGGLGIAGIELLYARLFIGLPESFQASLAAFDLTARGNIADWFAALTLFTGAFLSALVYLIRRHRLDDYRGRYRIWQWAAVCFVIGSLDAATSVHAILRPSMIELTGTTLLGDGAIWCAILVGVALAICFIRLAIEIKGSRLTTMFLVLSAGSYVGFVVVNYSSALNVTELVQVIVSSATLLAGHFCLVYSIALYGRHVYQEAQGTRRASRTKPRVKKKTTSVARSKPSRREQTAGAKSVRVDSAHEKSTVDARDDAVPTISKRSIKKTVSAAEEDAPEDSSRPMSKAERRRLRKLQRRQQRNGAHDE